MARPLGHRINRQAWDDLLAIRGKSLTEVAELADDTPRPTLSGIVGGHARASTPVAHRIAAVLDVNPATLFPTLAPGWQYDDADQRAKKSAATKRTTIAKGRAA